MPEPLAGRRSTCAAASSPRHPAGRCLSKTVTATFPFAGIAGSTALTESHGDEEAAQTARISAEAKGGEVLLTASTAALAPEPDGVVYHSRGRRELPERFTR